jgi:hypothetical protein
MKINPENEGAISVGSTGIGPVTSEMVRKRAVELAIIDGRPAHEVSKSDWETARRELTGNPDIDPEDTLLESVPESERWDPVPGSTGEMAPTISGDGEDDEGRSVGEKLIDEGVREADHDQMLKAARANNKIDRDA